MKLSRHILAAFLASAAAHAEETPIYQQILDSLKTSQDVLPHQPNVAPPNLLYNAEGVVPPMCYTRTEVKNNPCYVCHQDGIDGRENVMNDGDLQQAYSFSDVGLQNHWKNLFEDRTERVKAISDDEILNYISGDNYSELPSRLRAAEF